LKALNASGARKVPVDAPISFVPARYGEYLDKARKAGDDTAFRHYWELCIILALRDRLRSGDIFVPGSRRYADPATYLYTPQQCQPKQAEYCRLVSAQVLSSYTHVSDQHSTFGTKVIVPTAREAHYVQDDFLGNATDLPIHEHATDTHGVTLINFALFDLVGKVLSPRIRDLGKITLIRDDTPTETGKLYPHAGPLLGARWNEALIDECWGDLLRMAGSLKYGQATASLIVGKWSAASRQNTLAAALKEWRTLRRTIHAAKYLSDPAYRRKIARQLNKGEGLHALRRDLHYAQQGTIGKPLLADQTEQAWCLTVLTNSVISPVRDRPAGRSQGARRAETAWSC
jgi:TnpA family transposase